MIKRILPEELELGMFIESAVFEKAEDEKRSADFVDSVLVDTEEKLKKYKEKGLLKYIYIDTDKTKKIVKKEEPPEEKPPEKKPVVEKVVEKKPSEPEEKKVMNPVPFKEEIKVATEVKKQAHNVVKGYLEDARAGKTLDSEAVKNQASDMVDSILRNDNALISLTRLKSFDEYTFTHCVNVAVLVTSFAKRLGFNRNRLERLASGGLLHDVGKMMIPDEILNKPGKFTPEERQIVNNHPVYSAEILEKSPDIESDSIRLAFEHHERLDGTGYPRGLKTEQLHIDTNIVSICDVYDALTSARVYKPGFPLPKALQIIKENAGRDFKENLVDVFINIVGAYPVGSVVELNTGELAVVTEINDEDSSKPWVIIVTDWKKKSVDNIEQILIGSVAARGREIVKYHDPHEVNIDPEKYLSQIHPA